MPVFHVEMRWRCAACQTENLGRHKTCQNCSKPKDRERFYDAPETESAATHQAVVDADLVARATAGADWQCRYCGTHQPRRNAECANCGAPATEAEERAKYDGGGESPRTAAAVVTEARRASKRRVPNWAVRLGAVLLVITAALFFLFRTRVVEAEVVERSWEHAVVVERYQIVPGQGFAERRPKEAFDVVRVGERHHHDQRVQDGTQRESYTERVACGEDCSTTSVRCTENDNGFKTCSGGDRVCRTRYCSETRYRDVPKYKNVPVFQPWYTWRAWEWKVHRTVLEKGSEETPRWPADERVALDVGCGPGERERAQRKPTYEIVFTDAERERYLYRPLSLEDFSGLTRGAKRQLQVGRTRNITIVSIHSPASSK